MRVLKIKYREVILIKNLKTKKEYVLQGYVACDDYLIPFVPHWNRGSEVEYWEPHYAKRDTWVSMENINYSEWSITPKFYKSYKEESKENYKKILEKYHRMF